MRLSRPLRNEITNLGERALGRKQQAIDSVANAGGEHCAGQYQRTLWTGRSRPCIETRTPNRIRGAILFRERVAKEAVHELGHVFGVGNCRDWRCVVAFSNSLADTDYKGQTFCARCWQQIRR